MFSTTRRDRLAATAVSSQFVKEQIDQSPCRRVLVLLDCCYSGAFASGLTAKSDQRVDLTEPFDGRGRVVLAASSSTEYAFEGQQLTKENPAPSIFTSALIEGLETGAADRDQDGRIAADELYEYVFDQVRERTPYQTPTQAVSSVQGKLYVARNRQPVRPPELSADLRQAITNPLANIREAAIPLLQELTKGSDATMAALARQTLQQLTDDDSRRVAAAAANALKDTPTPADMVGRRAHAADQVDVQLTREAEVRRWTWRWPDGSVERYSPTTRYRLTDDFGEVEVPRGANNPSSLGAQARTHRRVWQCRRAGIVLCSTLKSSFVWTYDGDYAAKIPDPLDTRKGLRDGDVLPPRFAAMSVQRNDKVFRSIREGKALRLVVKADQEAAMISHAYWVARLRGHV